ncbi:MAG TPA: tyrosine-type recombinase/integrase [Candidatus Limnocylindria bacterium]|nr:tyrosine-type recombinase/integrase [Candidatus Limnocylindria bacterium]
MCSAPSSSRFPRSVRLCRRGPVHDERPRSPASTLSAGGHGRPACGSTPTQLRHTWASSMLAAGHSKGDVMQLAGWTDRSMLSRYGASAAAERARAACHSPIDRLARQR